MFSLSLFFKYLACASPNNMILTIQPVSPAYKNLAHYYLAIDAITQYLSDSIGKLVRRPHLSLL